MPNSIVVSLVNITYNFLTKIDNFHLVPFLASWPAPPFKIRTVSPSTLPVLSFLQELEFESNTEMGRIIKTLTTGKEKLCWGQTYSKDDFGPGFLEKYGWTELIGLRGPVASEDIACGFLLLGPDIEYPKHSHQADEIYIPMTSESLWIKDEGDWEYMPVGKPIYHRSWQTHGM